MENKKFIFELNGKDSSFYCYIKISGKLTHEDYESFVPIFDNALKDIKEPKVNCLIDITQLVGWELQAAWDDLKFGLSHNSDFNKIAVVSNNALYKYAIKIANWFTHYEMKNFENIDEVSNELLKSSVRNAN